MQVGEQSGGDEVGDAGDDRGGAVAVAAGEELGLLAGVGFFGFEGYALLLFAEVGGDDVEDPAGQDPQLLRAVVCGLGDQMFLGLGDGVGGHVGRELVEAGGDHLRLLHADVAAREAVGQRGSLGRERLREALLAARWCGRPGRWR